MTNLFGGISKGSDIFGGAKKKQQINKPKARIVPGLIGTENVPIVHTEVPAEVQAQPAGQLFENPGWGIGEQILEGKFIRPVSLNVVIRIYRDNDIEAVRYTGEIRPTQNMYAEEYETISTILQTPPMLILADEAIPFELALVSVSAEHWMTPTELETWAELVRNGETDEAKRLAASVMTKGRYETILKRVAFRNLHEIINVNLMIDILRAVKAGVAPGNYSLAISIRLIRYERVDEVMTAVSHPAINRRLELTESFDVAATAKRIADSMDAEIADMRAKTMKSGNTAYFVNDGVGLTLFQVPTQVGYGHYEIAEDKRDWLFNPTMNKCIFHCLAEANVIVSQEEEKTIIDELKVKSLEAIPDHKIDKLTEILHFTQKGLALHVYTFDGQGQIKKTPLKHPLSSRETKNKRIIKLLKVSDVQKRNISSHVMLIRSDLVVDHLKRNDLVFIDETVKASIQDMRDNMNYKPFKNIKDSQTKPTKAQIYSYDYDRVWLYDFETYPDDENEHIIYQSSLLHMSDVYNRFIKPQPAADGSVFVSELDGPGFYLRRDLEIKSLTHTTYGHDAVEKFIDLLDQIVEKTKKKIMDLLYHEFDTPLAKRPIPWEREVKKKGFMNRKKQLCRSMKQKIIGHNSAKYDMFVLLNASNRYVAGLTGNPVEANGYISVEYKDVIEFIDFYKFMPASLSNICDTMRIPTEYGKGDMPYDFVRKDTLFYKGPLPGLTKGQSSGQQGGQGGTSPLWKGDIHDPEYRKAAGIRERVYDGRAEFDLEEHVTMYAKLDVISLAIAVHRYSYGMWRVTMNGDTNRGLYALDYLTLPMLAGAFGMRDVNYDKASGVDYPDDQKVWVTQNFFVDKYMREGVNGGLVTVNNSYYEAPWYKEYVDAITKKEANRCHGLIRRAKGSGEYMDCVDVTSLYPSAMANATYPTGKPVFVPDSELELYCQRINNHGAALRGDPPYFMAEVDIQYTDQSRNGVRPLLPSKFKDGALVYDFYDKNNYVVCSTDLFEAIKHNHCLVTKVHSLLKWPGKRAIFAEPIWRCFRARQQAKREGNAVMSELLKLMMNSLYGKMIQKVHLEQKRLLTNKEQLHELYQKGQLGNAVQLIGDNTGFKMLADRVINEDTATQEELDKLINRCPHLGVFILAQSKVIMNNARAIIGGFDKIVDFYQDTDSFYMMHNDYLRLKYDGSEYRLSGYFEPPNPQNPNRPNPQGLHWVNPDPDVNNAVLTQFHDDTDDKVHMPMIIRFGAAASKVKSVEYACIEKAKKPMIWIDDASYTNPFNNVIFTKKKQIPAQPAPCGLGLTPCVLGGYGAQPQGGTPTLKFKGSFKGFKAKDDATNPAYSGWAAKVVEEYDHRGLSMFDEEERSTVPTVKKLCAELIHSMIPIYELGNDISPVTAKSFKIRYGQFKKDTRAGKGVSSIQTTKVIGQAVWEGRHFHEDTLHWHAFGSNYNASHINDYHFAQLQLKKPRGRWSFAPRI